MPTYAKPRRDAEYLEGLIEVNDLVEVDAAVRDLMEEPSKAKAAELYSYVISQWFSEHKSGTYMGYPKVRKICRDYGHEFYLT